MGTCDDFKFLAGFNPFVPGNVTSCGMWLGFAMSVELAHHWARNLVPTLLLIAPSPNPWISISLLCIFCTLKNLSLHRRHSKPLKSLFHLMYCSRARNIDRSTDNVRTDCGVDRSTFLLAGHVDRSHAIVLTMTLIKISILFTSFSCYQYMYVVSPCVLCETGTVVYNSYIETLVYFHFATVIYLYC